MVLLVAGVILLPDKPASAQADSKPDLVVAVAIDQFGSLLFDRWRTNYRGGIKRLIDEGIVFSNAYQSHGITETCAGHSTLLTGKYPGHTGIVANEWYDTATGKQVYCVADPNFSQAHDPKARKVGPSLLVASTLGDWLKEQQPASRVVVVSGKDRASITMAGHRADGVFWYADKDGFTTFVATGEDPAAKLAPVSKVNAKVKEAFAGDSVWTYSDESCRSLEDTYRLGGVSWRSSLPPEVPVESGKAQEKARPLHLMDPFTLAAVRDLVDNYRLGQRGVTDLLAIGLSATDFIGHGYGTQGPEMCDQIHRLDRDIGELLAFIDSLRLKVLLVVTADHGGSDFPERLAQQGFASARRIDPGKLLSAINTEVKGKLALEHASLVTPDSVQFYAVSKEGRKLEEPMRSKVIEAALDAFKRQPEVEQAFSLEELLAHKVTVSVVSDYSLKDRFAQSAMRGRTGDIVVAYKSGVSTAPVRPTRFVMGHAGPYHHDTAVPIIFWWKDAKAGTRILPVATTSIAPTLANIVGVRAPADLDGSCLDLGYPGVPPC
ncbi:MAG: alkaline phosphatase family protein [Alphaproteobacteria bacterium]|nr:alkaline phosphatase family protein [Alphaproteobacteria bacterium]